MRSMQSDRNLLKADQLGRNGNIAKTRVADDNLPLFYFSILPSNYPDTIYKIRPNMLKEPSLFCDRYQMGRSTEISFTGKKFE